MTDKNRVSTKETGTLYQIEPPIIADIARYRLDTLLLPGAESKITPLT